MSGDVHIMMIDELVWLEHNQTIINITTLARPFTLCDPAARH